jgi:hypothetical protein
MLAIVVLGGQVLGNSTVIGSLRGARIGGLRRSGRPQLWALSGMGPGCGQTPFKSAQLQGLCDLSSLQFPQALISLTPKLVMLRQNQSFDVHRCFHTASVKSSSQAAFLRCLLGI